MAAVQESTPTIGVVPACAALGLPRATFYRRLTPRPLAPAAPRPRPPRALADAERDAVLDQLHAPRFVDLAPAEIYSQLLDEGTYLCSTRTMYRLLAAHDEVRERRRLVRRSGYVKPELLATAPNQVWSWDITKLLGPVKWTYFYLYVILDIFSRYVVGWLVAHRESAALAGRLIAETCEKENIAREQLILHADRGGPMKAKATAQLLADLGVTKSHSRPYVSDDNPFSESQFKTLKYRPEFPERFGCLDDARAFCRPFFDWYNREHRHAGIAMLTPEMVHYGRAPQVIVARQTTLQAAYLRHPERFVRRAPQPAPLPEAVWINPPQPAARKEMAVKNEATMNLEDPTGRIIFPETNVKETTI
jgi:putative transposase